MPGPISASYDPEWGTSEKAGEIRESLQEMYELVSEIIDRDKPERSKPIDIRCLVSARELSGRIPATLKERQWRLIRFALERSLESI